MKLPFLTTFLIFIIWLTIRLHQTKDDTKKREAEFWEKEHKANFVRKKNIDNLSYIPFDISQIPIHPEISDDRVNEYIRELSTISGSRILNCTGKSNTDLKLEYGTANITKLTEYDGNFTILVRSIARLAEKYLIYSAKYLQDLSSENTDTANSNDTAALSASLKNDARILLEYGVSIGSDVRLNYELLGGLYAEEKAYDKIKALIKSSEALNSLSKAPIQRALTALIPEDLEY